MELKREEDRSLKKELNKYLYNDITHIIIKFILPGIIKNRPIDDKLTSINEYFYRQVKDNYLCSRYNYYVYKRNEIIYYSLSTYNPRVYKYVHYKTENGFNGKLLQNININ